VMRRLWDRFSGETRRRWRSSCKRCGERLRLEQWLQDPVFQTTGRNRGKGRSETISAPKELYSQGQDRMGDIYEYHRAEYHQIQMSMGCAKVNLRTMLCGISNGRRIDLTDLEQYRTERARIWMQNKCGETFMRWAGTAFLILTEMSGEGGRPWISRKLVPGRYGFDI